MDNDLEAAIDRVGRGKVFDHARALGWKPNDTPPKSVWWGIVADVEAGRGLTFSEPSLCQTLFGFDL
jgi:hypothetical protein